MAFRNVLECYVCERRFAPRLMTRIDGDANAAKREIAILRRDGFRRPALEVTELTKICTNCNQSINNEIVAMEQDPNCLRLNVLTQTRNSTCFLCNAVDQLTRLSMECKVNVFISHNIFIPENVKSCQHHLDDEGLILEPLKEGLLYINRPYVLKGQYLQAFLQGLRNVALNQTRIIDENSFSDSEFECLCPMNKEQFRELFRFCERVPCTNGYRYVGKKDLLMFLCKLRQGLSDEFLTVMFKYSSRQATSLAVTTVRQSLMLLFVPQNIGFNAITREDYINNHVTDFSNELYNPEPQTPRAILCIDGTYIYIQKSSNFRALRQSFCMHKGQYLVKPVMIVAPDGYILEIQGPYFSDQRNNDAALLRNEFERDFEGMRNWLHDGDIAIVDRGYRDVTGLLTRLGIRWKMPALLPPREHQLSAEDANESRLVTKQRWVVEARNAHLKLIFKFFQQKMQMHHIPHLSDFCKIAGAIINRYHPTIQMEEATVARANEMLQKARQPNVIQALVEIDNLRTRNAQRWILINEAQLLDFPILDVDYLKNLTVGIYQVKLAASYIQDTFDRENDEELHIEMLRDENRLPEPGLLRVRVFFRFRNAQKYQLWISYLPNGDNERDDEMIRRGEMMEQDEMIGVPSQIQGYYSRYLRACKQRSVVFRLCKTSGECSLSANKTS